VTNEEHVDIRITRTGNRKTSNILERILDAKEDLRFPSNDDHECMYEDDLERVFQYSFRKNPILEHLPKEGETEEEGQPPQSPPIYPQTLKPMQRDVTGAVEQRGRLRTRRYDRGDEVVWVVQIDRHRARFLDRIFSDFMAFLRRAFNAE
jgi:hypothetical protein